MNSSTIKSWFGKVGRTITNRSEYCPTYKDIEIPKFTPQEDITAYEVAICMAKPPKFWTTEGELLEWKKSLPENIKRHYTFNMTKCVVGWEYK